MNKLNDTDLREALRRREAKRPQVDVPEDFLSRVMQEVEPQQRPTLQPRHRWLWVAGPALAIAASIALLVLLVKEPKATQPEALSFKPRSLKLQPSKPQASTTQVQSFKPSPQKTQAKHTAKKARKNEMDSLMEQLERELADVRDSCYLAQVERLIADNPDLQQLMYDMTNQKQ